MREAASKFLVLKHTKTSRVRGGSVAIPRRLLARSRLAIVCPSVQLSEHTQSCPSVQLSEHTQSCPSAQGSQARTQSERARFVTAQDTISSSQPFSEAVVCLCRVFFLSLTPHSSLSLWCWHTTYTSPWPFSSDR